MATAVDRGLKRICRGCGARFYDMNKSPVKCPKCGEEFTGEVKVKTRMTARKKAEETQAALAAAEEAKTDVSADENTVSLDEVAEEENQNVEIDIDELADIDDNDDDDFSEDSDDDIGLGNVSTRDEN